MVKTIIYFLASCLILGLASFFIQNNLLETSEDTLVFSLKSVYLFFGLSTFLIGLALLLLSSINRLKDQIGFIYLATIVLKVVIFAAIFYESIFTVELTTINKVSLIIPMFFFLIIEVVFMAKILKKIQ